MALGKWDVGCGVDGEDGKEKRHFQEWSSFTPSDARVSIKRPMLVGNDHWLLMTTITRNGKQGNQRKGSRKKTIDANQQIQRLELMFFAVCIDYLACELGIGGLVWGLKRLFGRRGRRGRRGGENADHGGRREIDTIETAEL